MNINPQMIVNMLLQQNPMLRNNPMVNNALNMLNSGNIAGLNGLMNNLCQNQGIDVNKAINDIKRQYGL